MTDQQWHQWYRSFFDTLSLQQQETLTNSPSLRTSIEAGEFSDAEKLINQILFNVAPPISTPFFATLPQLHVGDGSSPPGSDERHIDDAGGDE